MPTCDLRSTCADLLPTRADFLCVAAVAGVLWLNTALTFSSKKVDILKKHTQFWAPVIEGIIRSRGPHTTSASPNLCHSVLIKAQAAKIDCRAGNAGLVFVLWGGIAHKLQKMVLSAMIVVTGGRQVTRVACQVTRISEELGNRVPIKFVQANHPAVESFHQTNTFTRVAKHLASLRLPPVNWLPSRVCRIQETGGCLHD